MKTTKNKQYCLMEFQDTLGDQAGYYNKNFQELDNEIYTLESAVEEFVGKDVFENVYSLSQRAELLEMDDGGVNILRGTFRGQEIFDDQGEWEVGRFKNSGVAVVENFPLETEGRPNSNLTYSFKFPGSSGGIHSEMGQYNIPIENDGVYSLMFYAKVATESANPGDTGLDAKLKVGLVEHGHTLLNEEEKEAGHIVEIPIQTYAWARIMVTFPYNPKKEENEEILAQYCDLLFESNANHNNFYINGISLQKGPYCRDWNMSPGDVIMLIGDVPERFVAIENNIGDMDDITTTDKTSLVNAINEINARPVITYAEVEDINSIFNSTGVKL